MPLHDWTRVTAGTYHDFHNSWITHLKELFNSGLLPSPYYALGEQRAGDTGPDLLALRAANEAEDGAMSSYAENAEGEGMVAVADAPPVVHLEQEASMDAAYYLSKRRTVVIRHATGDRIVALVEIVSPANKHGKRALDDLATKIVSALKEGIHVLVIDLFPPSRNDPRGIHGLVWESLGEAELTPPPDRKLTLVSYRAKTPVSAYYEPTRVGLPLAEMPLFLTNSHYIRVPLETTYREAWTGVPQRWRRVIDPS